MHRTKIIRLAVAHVEVRCLPSDKVNDLAAQLWISVLSEPDGFQGAALARKIAKKLGEKQVEKRESFTLSDLAMSKKRFIQWLSYDGNPPIVEWSPPIKRHHSPYYRPTKEERPVTDEDTFDQWWAQYRQELAEQNAPRQQTHTQFVAECLSQYRR